MNIPSGFLTRPLLSICGILLTEALPLSAEIKLLTGDANNKIYNSDASLVDVSADGDFVMFHSKPPVPGFGTPAGITQVGFYMRRISTNTLKYVDDSSVPGIGQGSCSDDGRYIAMRDINSLIYWRDTVTNVTRLITPAADGACHRPIISADGRYVAYSSLARNLVSNSTKLQPAAQFGVYLYDSVTKKTVVVSLTQSGAALNAGIGGSAEFDFSADGKFIVFTSIATNVHPDRTSAYPETLGCVYRRNLGTGAVDLLNKNGSGTVADGGFAGPRISTNGSRVCFLGAFVGTFGGVKLIDSVPSQFGSDVYVKDADTGKLWWASRTTDNAIPNGLFLAGLAISGDGLTVVFSSTSTNLVKEETDTPGDSGYFDVFRADLSSNDSVKTTMVTKPAKGTSNVIPKGTVLIPADGQYVAFDTSQVEAMLGTGTESGPAQGFGVSPPVVIVGPEIVVEQPADTELVDGTAKKSFGSVALGATGRAKTFTVRNIGSSNLTGLAITKAGTQKGDFVVSALGKTSLIGGGKTTFTVTFKPTVVGTRSAVIRIASNDPNENPFDITLSGMGVAP